MPAESESDVRTSLSTRILVTVGVILCVLLCLVCWQLYDLTALMREREQRIAEEKRDAQLRELIQDLIDRDREKPSQRSTSSTESKDLIRNLVNRLRNGTPRRVKPQEQLSKQPVQPKSDNPPPLPDPVPPKESVTQDPPQPPQKPPVESVAANEPKKPAPKTPDSPAPTTPEVHDPGPKEPTRSVTDQTPPKEAVPNNEPPDKPVDPKPDKPTPEMPASMPVDPDRKPDKPEPMPNEGEIVDQSDKPLTAAELIAKRKQRRVLEDQLNDFYGQANHVEALKTAEQMLAMDREMYDDAPAKIHIALGHVAWLRADQSQLDDAVTAYDELLRVRTALFGEDGAKTKDAQVTLASISKLKSLDQAGREEVSQSFVLHAQMMALYEGGKFDDAIPLAEQIVATRKKHLGDKDKDYAQSLNDLAGLHIQLGKIESALPLFEQAAAIQLELLGETSNAYQLTTGNIAECHKRLATQFEQQKEYAKAVEIWQKILASRAKQFGPMHWEVTDIRLRIASLNLTDEQVAKAGEAAALSDSINGLLAEKKFDEAVKIAKQVVEIRKQAYGEEHVDVAHDLALLAAVHQLHGQDEEATKAFEEAVKTSRETLGPLHPQFGVFLFRQADQQEQLGSAVRAERFYGEALKTFSTVQGIDHPNYIATHDRLVRLLRQRGLDLVAKQDFDGARTAKGELIKLLEQRYGLEHWRSRDARDELERLDELEKLDPMQQTRLSNATNDLLTSIRLYNEQKFAEALKLAEQSYATRRQVLGDDHLDCSDCLNVIGAVQQELGQLMAAEESYFAARQIRREQIGVAHPKYGESVSNLAELYRIGGQYEKAEPLYDEALEISRLWSDENSREFSTTLNNQALFFYQTGKLDRAKPLYEQSLKIAEAFALDYPGDYAQSLNNLASLYRAMGDVERAETYYTDAMKVYAKSQGFGDQHPLYASALINMGMLRFRQKKNDDAEKLFKAAEAILEKAEPVGKHRDYMKVLSNLASLYHEVGRYDESGALYLKSLEIHKTALGETHPDYARELGNLAAHYRGVGKFAEAEQHYNQALEILKQHYSAEHHVCAAVLRNMAKLFDSQGDVDKAEPLLRQSLDISRRQLDQTASVQSERQQLSMAKRFRDTLDMYLSLTQRAKTPVDRVYKDVLKWKGSVFARQLQLRNQRRIIEQSKDPSLIRLVAELDTVSCRIATLALSVPGPDQSADRLKQIGELTVRKEAIEIELAGRSKEFRDQKQAAELTPAGLQQQLPSGLALVDVLQYTHHTPPPDGKGLWKTEQRLVAFLVRGEGAIQRIELGPSQYVEEMVPVWRSSMDRKHPVKNENDSAVFLRNTVWLPIEKQLKPDERVLISPDGCLSRMPFAALPGLEKNKYLIEERAIALFPIPQLLPELAAKTTRPDPSMLILGDVDYGEATDEEADSDATRGPSKLFNQWKPLDGTRTEMATVADSFDLTYPEGAIIKLRRNRASEQTFRERAKKHRWLHLATHGFFAPKERHSALAPSEDDVRGAAMSREAAVVGSAGIGGVHPGVLSGVVLAGANQPATDGASDGILTAMEVAEMDLKEVDVVVLSACETGLGEVAGGEGVLGIQRAFQLAGADTVIASLWTVDDRATQLLMVHFYDQLWQEDAKSKIEIIDAFRESQLMLLREGIKRGFTVVKREKNELPPRTPPYLWAAFSISGNWR